ncbi:hypothetical protein LXA43DRAFT_1031003 [Ganoderma leucocontextum]|nr:hypothetical protein LXA43DRAFT_1031003 [Ganoderma leucocontextum]
MKPNSVLERHPDLYFEDGDVVLAVKQAPTSDDEPLKNILFRVHKFLLKHHSATFFNFFADANAAPAEVYDGVPLAEMYGDKAEDFALLLSYLYNPSSLVFKRHDPNTPATVSGVVRLADKYMIEPLHRRLVQQVCEDWPATLHDYDIQQAEIDTMRSLATTTPGFKYTPERGRLSDVIPEPASAILFSQEFGCPHVLPTAFYRLSLIPVESDWDTKSPWPHQALARWSILDRENFLRYIHGCQMLATYRPGVSRFMCISCIDLWEDEDEAPPCYEFIARLFEVAWARTPSLTGTHADPLRSLAICAAEYCKMPELSKEHFPHGLCMACEDTLTAMLVAERKRVWENLPQWFKLE